jgi:hypothetical protein
VEAATDAQTAAREARSFEVAMNKAQAQAQAMAGDVEESRRTADMLQSVLKERDGQVNALRIELAGLKSSFKNISDDNFMEQQAIHPRPERQQNQQQQQQQQEQLPRQQQRVSPSQLRPVVLRDSEHWLHGSTITMASLPSPSPRTSELPPSSVPALHPQQQRQQQQQFAPTRAFGSVVDANAKIEGDAMKQSQKQQQQPQQQQQQQYQFGAWPVERQQQQDFGRNDRAVGWTSGGYSDGAAKKNRQHQGSSRTRLVFLR